MYINYVFYFSGEDQEKAMAKEPEKQKQPQTKKTRLCTKCKNPMKGHPRSHCPAPST